LLLARIREFAVVDDYPTVEGVDNGGLDAGAEKKIQQHVGNLRSEIENRARELSA